MVTILEAISLLNSDGDTPLIEGDGGSGTTTTTTTPTTSGGILLGIPNDLYRKTRHPNNIDTFPEGGGTPLQSPQQFVGGPLINFNVTDTGVVYQWAGHFTFDNAEYDFAINATNKFRVKLDGVTVIDDFNSGATRARIERIDVSSGRHLITVEWAPNGGNSINFNATKVPIKVWVSCDDGLEREGDPPEGWIKTASGCFKPPLSDTDTTVDLLDVVDIRPGAETRIERAYVKGSGTALSSHRIKFFNRSSNMTVNVNLAGPKPVKFVTAFQLAGDVIVGGFPADSFELATQKEKEIDVLFTSSELDPLPDGLIRSEVLVSLSAGTITIPKDSDGTIDIGVPLPADAVTIITVEPPPVEPPPPAPTPTWRDCSSSTEVVHDGFPPTDWVLRSDGCYVPPVPPPPAITLNITQQELLPLFDGSRSTARARLNAVLEGDDPTTFTYAWNFDVNRQGAGTGNTAIQNTIANWLMTDADLILLEDPPTSKTTRVVEVIARRGIDVIRSRITVVLDNPELVFITPPLVVDEPIVSEPTTTSGGAGGGGDAPLIEGDTF